MGGGDSSEQCMVVLKGVPNGAYTFKEIPMFCVNVNSNFHVGFNLASI